MEEGWERGRNGERERERERARERKGNCSLHGAEAAFVLVSLWPWIRSLYFTILTTQSSLLSIRGKHGLCSRVLREMRIWTPQTSEQIPSTQSSSLLGLALSETVSPCLHLSFQDTFPFSYFESHNSSSCPQLAYFTGHEKHLQVRGSQKWGPRPAAQAAPGHKSGMQILGSHPDPLSQKHGNLGLTKPSRWLSCILQVKLTSPLKTVQPPLVFRHTLWGHKMKILLSFMPLLSPAQCLSSHSSNKVCVCGAGGGFSF